MNPIDAKYSPELFLTHAAAADITYDLGAYADHLALNEYPSVRRLQLAWHSNRYLDYIGMGVDRAPFTGYMG